VQTYEEWDFRAKTKHIPDINALFIGYSNTVKTNAAEVLANDLQLDLYRINLSAVVSEYIGETEKNLRKLFDAADKLSTILLFDEADALFGKRSGVKDSHNRYANIEISYLVQSIEKFRGLAILSIKEISSIEPAFARHIRFKVNFP
jgi:SpoVK/Ycf46/Vps4 family AAA+-type ATPase